MKKKLLYLLLMVSGVVSAQIINIPDPVFKSILLSSSTTNNVAVNSTGVYFKIDANMDGEIQESEASAVWGLNLPAGSGVTSLQGISAFPNLRKLNCSLQQLTLLDVSMLTYLEELNCANNYILEALQLPSSTNLKKINCSNNSLDVLTIPSAAVPVIKELDCSNNFITALDISAFVSIERLICTDNLITNLLDFTNIHTIKQVYCDFNDIPELIIADKLNLTALYCAANQLQELELGFMPALTTLSCGMNELEQLNISGCPTLVSISAAGNHLSYVNLKNGNTNLNMLTVASTPLINIYLCIDEGEEQALLPFILPFYFNSPNAELEINTYCTPTPGGTLFNTANFNAKYDYNANGCDNGDIPLRYMKYLININGTETTHIANYNGEYTLYTSNPEATITPVLPAPWYIMTPSSTVIDLDSSNTEASFCMSNGTSNPDGEILGYAEAVEGPGFEAYYYGYIKNNGSSILSGTIDLIFDDTVLDFIETPTSANPLVTDGHISISYSNLLPFETQGFYFIFHLNAPTDSPPVNIGDVLNFTVNLTCNEGDENLLDNSMTNSAIVAGSFDPNDITCLEGEVVHPDKIGEYLHYKINFENTGTAPATFIVVKDVIDAQKFDINSLQLINASHNVQTKIIGNKVEFRFDDINLMPLDRGNIIFKIKTKPTVAVNSTVTQKADIFFDYNWPITTNDANTTFTVLSRGDFALDNTVKVYPNPAKNIVNIAAGTELQSIQLYNVQGRLLQSSSAKGISSVLDMSSKPAGIYFIKINTEKGAKVEKVIKE
jgi:hypothetical protein